MTDKKENHTDKNQLNNIDKQTLLQMEYNEVGANWRFLVETRFKILGFFLTLIAGLGVAFTFSGDPVIRTIISMAGIVASFSLWIVELRNRTLYRTILERGVELERLLKIKGGQYYLLQNSWKIDVKRGFFLTQSNIIDTLCISIFVMWLLAIIFPIIGTNYQIIIVLLSLICLFLAAFYLLRRCISMGKKMK